jgi:transglutaminase-like putative cysteine protease
MALEIALTHRAHYRYDRRVALGPQLVRLRPAPILAYALEIEPRPHFLDWQQDPFGNFLARIALPEKTDRFTVTVDLLAEMAAFRQCRRRRCGIGGERVSQWKRFHGRVEAIAAARNGRDQARPVIPQRPPELADALHQCIVRDGKMRPDRSKELVLRHETARIFHQVPQHREGLRPKGNLGAVEKEATATQIEDITIKPESLGLRLS